METKSEFKTNGLIFNRFLRKIVHRNINIILGKYHVKAY